MKKIVTGVAYVLFSVSCAIGQDAWKKVKEELIVATPAFKQCHASTIVALSSKKMLAAWFGGSGEGGKDVSIWLAENNQGKWSEPVIVATGVINDTLRFPTWNPVLFQANNGKLFLFYKVGPSPQQWWGMVMTSGDEGKTWSVPERLEAGLLGPIKNKPVQLKDGTILAGSSTETNNKWRVHIERSEDNGRTWKAIPVDDDSPLDAIQPSIVQYGDGRLQILCRSKQGAVVQAWSDDEGKTWSSLSKTKLANPNAGTDAVTLMGGQQMIVYNPDLPGKEWYDGRAKLSVAISEDGINWKDIIELENGTREEFSYPAVIQTKDGRVHITYTFDRKNIKHVVLEKIK